MATAKTGKNDGGQRSSAKAQGRAVARNVTAAKDKVVEGVASSLNMVLLTRKTIEDVIEDAVARGRMTRHDAQDIVQTLLQRGARATSDAVNDLERLVGIGGDQPGQQPIPGYDDLSAADVQSKLDDLSEEQLRNVRDYEKRNANRKTVLDPIERKLR